jgi:hypothetical protein
MNQPSIYLFGVLIEEPICTLTDFLVAIICFYYYIKLGKSSSWDENRLWRYYFFFIMLATFLGGLLGHAFLYCGSFAAMKLPGWLSGMFAMSVLSQISINLFFVEKNKFYFSFSIINVFIFMVMLLLELYNLAFSYVQIHSGLLLLLLILPMQVLSIKQNGSEKGKNIIYALLLAGIGSFFFTNKIGLNPWFNHIDISHFFLALSMYVISKAALYEERKEVL